ncbi:MAG: porin family protein [Bradyrhizobiaceae bacterium]|nr:porin family protein [Bradyrhizobiaceae bacterium]
MIKKLVFASASALMLVTVPVAAADLPSRVYVKEPMAPALFNWTGFYAGIQGGWAGGSDVEGWFGGGQFGFNYQAPGSTFVWGGEVDGAFTNIGNSSTALGITTKTEIDHFGTARLRVGRAFDTTLLYVTGGAAWAHNEISVTGLGRASKTHVGWTVGAGIEQAFGGGWSSKLEYLYADYGSANYFGMPSGGFDTHMVRAGLNYRFGAY